MLFAGICLALAAVVMLRDAYPRRRPFDADELRIIRGLADQTRRDQFHPFG